MLFMGIITWEPEKRDAVRKAFATPGSQAGKDLGSWSDIGGCRAFTLIDSDNPKAMVAAANFWTNIATVEFVPVIEAQEVMKLVASKK